LLHSRLEEEESETALILILAEGHKECVVYDLHISYFPQPPMCDLPCLLGFKWISENRFYHSSTVFWVKMQANMSLLLLH